MRFRLSPYLRMSTCTLLDGHDDDVSFSSLDFSPPAALAYLSEPRCRALVRITVDRLSPFSVIPYMILPHFVLEQG
jgi:hypothetical protein